MKKAKGPSVSQSVSESIIFKVVKACFAAKNAEILKIGRVIATFFHLTKFRQFLKIFFSELKIAVTNFLRFLGPVFGKHP